MYTGKLVFAQVMDHLPVHTFHRCVQHYGGHRRSRSFSCLDQFLCMAFAQLTGRRSLRELEICLRAQRNKLYHIGIRGGIARNTLAPANEVRDWRIWQDFAQALIRIARPLYLDEDLGLEFDNTVYALDSSTVDLSLNACPWARFRSTKGAVKIHTLLDLQGSIPTFVRVADGKMHDVKVLDELPPEPGAIYVMDRAYIDFQRLFRLQSAGAFFVVRAKSNLRWRCRYSRPVDKQLDLRCDQTIVLTGQATAAKYPRPLRRVGFRDTDQRRSFHFLTNFELPARTVADLYRHRWRVELFLRWLKQHLRIQRFLGTSENAVKTQIWIAASVYVLIAILKKRLELPHDPHHPARARSHAIHTSSIASTAYGPDTAAIRPPGHTADVPVQGLNGLAVASPAEGPGNRWSKRYRSGLECYTFEVPWRPRAVRVTHLESTTCRIAELPNPRPGNSSHTFP